MPQLDPSTFGSQLFWLLVCFGALYAGFEFHRHSAHFQYNWRRARRQLEGDLAEAEKLRGQAEAALKAYEDALAEARSRALALAQEMRAEVQAETDRQKAELDAKLAEQAAAADARLDEIARDAAMAGLKDAAADIGRRCDGCHWIADKASDGDVAKGAR